LNIRNEIRIAINPLFKMRECEGMRPEAGGLKYEV
jgi:hypothetical protein